MKYILQILILLASFQSTAHSQIVGSKDFQEIKKSYFQMLDLRVDNHRKAIIPKFGAMLSALGDQERGNKSTKSEEAGLIFIYDALFTMNTTLAATQAVLNLSALKDARAFAKIGASDQEELEARALYSINELTDAIRLRPNDRRIDSWLASAKTSLEKIRTGQISDTTLGAALDTIPARPTFNLWTSMLLFKYQDASSPLFIRLTDESKKFVDSVMRGNDPCVEKPQDCQSGDNAPYNFQASIVVLGDVFLRRAETLLKDNNIAGAMEMAAYAKGSYSKLNTPDHIETTQQWPDHDALTVRTDRLAKIQQAQLPTEEFISLDHYRKVYECSSCHGRARN